MLLNNLYLLEALDPVANAVAKFGKNAVNVAKKLYNNQPDLDYERIAKELLQYVIDADPDLKKKNVGWLLKQVGNKEIILPEDANEIRDSLTQFIRQKRVGRLPEPDLNKHTIDSLRDMLDQLGEVESKRQGGLGFDPSKMPGVEVYAKGGPYVILRTTDANSLAELGEGAIWCTRKSYGNDNSQAPNYLKIYGAIYNIFKDGKQFAQYTPDYSQIVPARSSTHLRPPKALASLMKPDPDIISGEIKGTKADLIDKMLVNYSFLVGIPDQNAERRLLNNLKTAVSDERAIPSAIFDCINYISRFGDPIPFIGEFLDTVQSIIPQSMGYTLKSLVTYVGGFETMPSVILDAIETTHDSEAAVQLAEVTKKRWPQLEQDWLFDDLDNAINYVAATAMVLPGLLDRIIKEGTIAQMLKYSIPLYKADKLDVEVLDRAMAAKINSLGDVKLVGKFAEEVGVTPNIAEHIMTSNKPNFIIAYCNAVGKALPGSDEKILRLGDAEDVWRWMRFRRKYDWPEAESVLTRNERYAKMYLRATGRRPRREGEKTDVKPKTPKEALNFALATGDEYLEGENLILQDLDTAITYAEHIVGPWPELEQKLKVEGTPGQKEKYLRKVLYGIAPD